VEKIQDFISFVEDVQHTQPKMYGQSFFLCLVPSSLSSLADESVPVEIELPHAGQGKNSENVLNESLHFSNFNGPKLGVFLLRCLLLFACCCSFFLFSASSLPSRCLFDARLEKKGGAKSVQESLPKRPPPHLPLDEEERQSE
jgi:hypothetical protein